MTKRTFPLQNPADAILFDCDGTLSTIEGIDELAKQNGIAQTVQALTSDAMTHTGLNAQLYEKRLQMVKPTQNQAIDLGKLYYKHRVPGIENIIQTFLKLNKTIYIISAGLYDSVATFGALLNIPQKNIFAVRVQFDAKGQYLDFDRNSPLISNVGKKNIVTDLGNLHKNMVFVGDGMNDVAVYDLVSLFIGYGGNFYRETIAERSDFYITSMEDLFTLVLTEQEREQLTAS